MNIWIILELLQFKLCKVYGEKGCMKYEIITISTLLKRIQKHNNTISLYFLLCLIKVLYCKKEILGST